LPRPLGRGFFRIQFSALADKTDLFVAKAIINQQLIHDLKVVETKGDKSVISYSKDPKCGLKRNVVDLLWTWARESLVLFNAPIVIPLPAAGRRAGGYPDPNLCKYL